MKGSVAEGLLPAVLRDLYVARKTGFLHFMREAERRSVCFSAGNIVHADTNVREERLGETLVGQGLLTEADLKRATGFVLRDKKRLGAVLVELGILDDGKLEDALALHVREILLKVLSWSEGSYEFEEKDITGGPEGATLKLSTGEVILEAVRRIDDPDVIRYGLGNIDRVLGLSSDPLLRFQKITLSPADGYILSRIDGTLSAREVVQVIPMVAEDTLKSLFGLLCTGVIEYLPLPPKVPQKLEAPRPLPKPAPTPAPPAPTPAPHHASPTPQAAPAPPAAAPPVPSPAAAAARPAPPGLSPEQEARRKEVLELFEGLKTKSHFEVLGIPRASNESQVKEAYFKLAKRFHPDSHHDPSLADLRDRIEAVFIRLGEAYEVLRDRNRRASYESDLVSRMPRGPVASGGAPPPPAGPDPEAETRLAEESVRRAEKLYAAEKYWDAIQLLEPALRSLKGKMLQRARVDLAKNYLKNPKWVKRAEEQLQNTIRDEANNVEAHFLLGGIYKASGLKNRAVHEYQRVLELKPEHEASQAALLELAPDEGAQGEEKPGGGFLKKFFGKS
jgi:curved DNA-binding protein CbpA